MKYNPFTWIEIYVSDLERARKFYESVLQVALVEMQAPGDFPNIKMLSFPWHENAANISGALIKMDGIEPGLGGTLVYFACEDCGVELSRVEAAGGKIVDPKCALGEHGYCAVALDTEGNRIGFHSMS